MSDKIEHTNKLHERKYANHSLFSFYCPGCKCGHSYEVPRWSFNGDYENPTFSPSLLLFVPETVDPVDGTIYPRKTVCHLFVKHGKIEFCGDCPHELSGQTLEMVPFPDGYGT